MENLGLWILVAVLLALPFFKQYLLDKKKEEERRQKSLLNEAEEKISLTPKPPLFKEPLVIKKYTAVEEPKISSESIVPLPSRAQCFLKHKENLRDALLAAEILRTPHF